LQLAGIPVPLSLNTFQFGFHNPVTLGSGNGATVGPVSFALDVTTGFSPASPDLFQAVASGDHYDTATLTETNVAGQPIAVWVLGTVFVTDDAVTGNSGALPAEELHFAFADITEGTSASTASWSLPTSSDTGSPGLPAGLTFSPLPTPPRPTNLSLQLASGNAPPVTIDLTAYQFGFHKSATFPTGGTGATEGPTSLDALDATAAYNASSPELFAQLTRGLAYDSAVLIQKDASGNPVAVWALGTVFVTDDAITGNGLPPEGVRGSNVVPTEELRFTFEDITEGTSAGSQSWNQLAGGNFGPGLPAGLTLSPLATPAPTNLTLQLGSGVHQVTLTLNSFQFGFHDPVTISSVNGGGTAGPVSFDALEVTAALSKLSPDLFHALTSGTSYDTATLTETNTAGQPDAVWVLQTVLVTDDAVTDDVVTGGSGLPAEGLRFAFGAITEVTNPNQASWDITQGRSVGPAGPAPATLAPLAPYSPTITVSAGPFTYDGNPHPATATATGVAGDLLKGSFTFAYYPGTSVSGTGSPTAPSNAGTYTVVAHFSSADPNYQSADSAALTFGIAQATPGITWSTPAAITYGAALGATQLDATANVPGTFVYTPAAGTVLAAGTQKLAVAFTPSDTTNYTSANASVQLAVNQAPLTITANSTSKTYGQAVTFAGTEFTTSGLVNGDTVTGVTLTSAGAAASAPVAGSPYAIVPGNAVGTGLGNYTISYASGTLTVNPAPLTVTADNQTKIVGEANPTFTVTYSGFVLGQGPGALGGALTFGTPATAGSPPGNYAITPGGLTSSNYAITFVSGTLTVLSDAQATTNLQAEVAAANLSNGIGDSLRSQLQSAIDAFNRGQTTAGVNQLGAFINHVKAQRGKQIAATLADALIADAQRIINAAE
jgi:type VI protein secretion system component Hcp